MKFLQLVVVLIVVVVIIHVTESRRGGKRKQKKVRAFPKWKNTGKTSLKHSKSIKKRELKDTDKSPKAVHCYNTTTHKAYVGRYDKTETGRTCQRWSSQSPNQHSNNDPTLFPDATLADAGNYCRDPDNEGFLWCYTTDTNKRWETCGISRCSKSGKHLGEFCNSASDCIETNAVCISNMCFCDFRSKYNTTVGDCVQDCDTMLTTFEKHPHTKIFMYNTLEYAFSQSSADGCLQICLSKTGCVSVEYFSSHGACYFSDISLQMMKDASPINIYTTSGDMYIRRCT